MSQRIPGPEDVGRFYDHFTRFFEIAWGESLHTGYWPDGEGSTDRNIPEAQVRLTEQVMNQLDVPAGAHVLDVGCGTGEPTLRLSRGKNCRVTGITISAKQVEAARQRAQREGREGQVQFQYADAMALPFAEASFDGAWALESLFHVSDTGLALRELYRCLKPGAPLVIADFICKVPMSPEDEQFHHDAMLVGHLHAIPAYEDLIRSAGFVLEETRELTPYTRRMSVVGQDILSEKREELRQAFGDELLAALDVSWNRASELGRKHHGYALFRMRKP